MSSPLLNNQVASIQRKEPMEELRNEVLEFFKNRMASIQRSEKLKELVYTELEAKLSEGELEFDQLMAILARLDNGANTSSDSIISIFRPSSSGQSTLTELVRSDSDTSDIAKAFAGYTSDDLQHIEKTMHSLRMITEKTNEKNPEEYSSEEL
ncbi:MAG: hypothetical protein ACRCZB_05195 [Bacteroidales bacterium]